MIAEVLACFLLPPALVGEVRGVIYFIFGRNTGCLWSYRLQIVSGLSYLGVFTKDTLSEFGLNSRQENVGVVFMV